MNKPVFGLLLGGVLGIFDGLSALVSAPETRPEIVGIVIGSTIKGLMAGVVIGLFARFVKSLPLTILFGLFVGASLAFWVASMQGKYYLEIMLPGSILGVVVGYATQRHGGDKTGRSKTPAAALILLGALLLAPAAQAQVDSKAAFETLKGLAGTWEGKGEGLPMTVTFEVASGGTIVMERLFARSEHEMINVYHLVDGELRIVHYCSMGNQPMMKLDAAASKPGDLVFTFAGGTNFDPAKDSYIDRVRIRIDGEDLAAEWGSAKAGKDAGVMKLQAHRTARPEPPAQAPAHSH